MCLFFFFLSLLHCTLQTCIFCVLHVFKMAHSLVYHILDLGLFLRMLLCKMGLPFFHNALFFGSVCFNFFFELPFFCKSLDSHTLRFLVSLSHFHAILPSNSLALFS